MSSETTTIDLDARGRCVVARALGIDPERICYVVDARTVPSSAPAGTLPDRVIMIEGLPPPDVVRTAAAIKRWAESGHGANVFVSDPEEPGSWNFVMEHVRVAAGDPTWRPHTDFERSVLNEHGPYYRGYP